MVARSAREAIRPFLHILRRWLTCITDQPIQVIPVPDDPLKFVISFIPQARRIKITTQDQRSHLTLLASVELVVRQPDVLRRAYVAEICGYFIVVGREDGDELLAYHWHPGGKSRIRAPHLHIATPLDISVGPQRLHRVRTVHFPTGFVPMSEIVRMLIEEFEVQPTRSDWTEILDTQ